MNWLDWLILLIVVLGAINGVKRGFVLSLFSLAGAVLALAAGWHFAPAVVEYFESAWNWQSNLSHYLVEVVPFPEHVGGVFSPGRTYSEFAESLLSVLAFVIIFVSIVILARLLGHFLKLSVSWGLTGMADRLLGGIFGFFTSAIAISVTLGILLMASTSVSRLDFIAAALDESAFGGELVRIFYAVSPLSDRFLEWIA